MRADERKVTAEVILWEDGKEISRVKDIPWVAGQTIVYNESNVSYRWIHPDKRGKEEDQMFDRRENA